jgi:galactonate dehydratase
MLVATVETFVVANPPPGFGGAYFVFVKVVTDDGIVGYGEAYGATVRPHVVAAAIEDLADQFLVGEDPHHVERFWRRSYSRGFTQRPDVTLQGAMSALEMACWDIVGKAAGKPVYELLGGRVHEALRTYTYLYPHDDDRANVYVDPALAAERAIEAVALGFTAVKFDPCGPYTAMGGHQPRLADIDTAVGLTAAVRDAVGGHADLLIGTHGQFTAGGAIRVANALAPYDPLWFEEPVPPDDVGAMAQVAARSPVPVATGERLTTKYEFARLLEARAASIIQPNLGRCGGLLEGKKIAGLAEAFGAQLAPHCYNGPIGLAANIQLAACSPNFLIIETIEQCGGFHADLLTTPIEWVEGRVVPSSAPGLGVELDEDVARANPYDGNALHIGMWSKPIDTAELDDRT